MRWIGQARPKTGARPSDHDVQWVETPQQVQWNGGTLAVAHQAWAVVEWPGGDVGDRLHLAMRPLRPGAWPLVQWAWRYQASSLALNSSLERKIRRLELAVDERAQASELGPRRDEWVALESLRTMRDAMVFGGESLVEVDGIVTVTSTPDLLLEDVTLLRARWNALGITVRPLPWEQALAIQRSWGVAPWIMTDPPTWWWGLLKRLGLVTTPLVPPWEPRVMLADRASRLVWPGWGHISDDPESGVYVGHTAQGQPVFVDFFQSEGGNAANILVVGNTGMGKSFWLKTVTRGWLAQGWGVVILDVDGEYAALCRAEGGTWIDVSGTQASVMPDPLAIASPVGAPDSDAMRYDRMLGLVSRLVQILGENEGSWNPVVEQAVMQIWQEYGVDPLDPHTWDRPPEAPRPTMREVYLRLLQNPDPIAQAAAQKLWVYIEGSQRQFFRTPAQQWDDMPTQLVVWHLGNLALQGGLDREAKLPPETAGRYLLVLHTTWEWLRRRRQREEWTVVLTDEGQRLLNQPVLGSAIADMSSTMRKWNGVLALATNTPTALWTSEFGRAMWATTPIKAFMKLEEAQARQASEALLMPEPVVAGLMQLPERHVLMRVWGDQWTEVQAQVPPTEAALYRTRG